MSEMIFCQSCGMPMGDTDEMYGTEKDGTKSKDYCSYCYADGEFTESDMSMEQMINLCIPHVVESNPETSAEDAKKMMEECFPTLKRWINA